MLTTVLQLAVIYLPQFNSIFSTTPLTALELLACVALSSTAFVAVEINKWIVRARTRS